MTERTNPMKNALRTCILIASLLAATAAMAEDAARARKWGLGWDQGLTVRRWLGSWELGVAAGPSDWLSESDQRSWDSTEPDSLQGRDSRHESSQRESGFVRLQAGRCVAGQGPLDLMAHVNFQYRWRDERRVYDWYYLDRNSFETTDKWTETWTASAAVRLAWRPLDALSIETAFGLSYSWSDWEEVRRTVRQDLLPPLESDEVTARQTKGSSRRFEYHGWYGLGSLSFIFWF